MRTKQENKFNFNNFLILFFLFFTYSLNSFSNKCEPLFHEVTKIKNHSSFQERLEITNQHHRISMNELVSEMLHDGKLIYKGDHDYQPGTEFLASNEFDWSKTPFDSNSTDVLVGFGTNSAWDIALRKKAKTLMIADWSPIPLIAQQYLVAPLIRISKSPAELIVMLAGMPAEEARNLTLSQAFNLAKNFDVKTFKEQSPTVHRLLIVLANNPAISDSELKFLTAYYRPRLGYANMPGMYGPFNQLRSYSFAFLHSFYQKRYDPKLVGNQVSVFSTQNNFNYLKNLFDSQQVFFAMASITDTKFYQIVHTKMIEKNYSKVSFSVTNIFDCGCYNGLTFIDFQNYLKNLFSIFGDKSDLTVFRTTNNVPPHGYYRYQIKKDSDIPQYDEKDSSALIYSEAG